MYVYVYVYNSTYMYVHATCINLSMYGMHKGPSWMLQFNKCFYVCLKSEFPHIYVCMYVCVYKHTHVHSLPKYSYASQLIFAHNTHTHTYTPELDNLIIIHNQTKLAPQLSIYIYI